LSIIRAIISAVWPLLQNTRECIIDMKESNF